MKIGILTFHNAENYGAVLQAYALKRFLTLNYPHFVFEIVNYDGNKISEDYRLIRGLNYFNHKSYIRRLISFIMQFVYLPQKYSLKKIFFTFRKKILIETDNKFNDFDCIIYGSDQIWNTNLTNNDMVFFGDSFAGKKIAYAASAGSELVITDQIKKLLEDFSHISCREESLSKTIQLLNIHNSVTTVCDPVFLLDKNEWLNFAAKPSDTYYVLSYKIGENDGFESYSERIGEILGKKVLYIEYLKNIKKWFISKKNVRCLLSPQEFVGYFAYADFIVTTSFHGTAFSLLFNKAFFVLTFTKGFDRISNLLSRFNFTDRIISDLNKFKTTSFSICYETNFDIRMTDYRNNSFTFLTEAINERNV